jgi:hypothetical protein
MVYHSEYVTLAFCEFRYENRCVRRQIEKHSNKQQQFAWIPPLLVLSPGNRFIKCLPNKLLDLISFRAEFHVVSGTHFSSRDEIQNICSFHNT